MKSQKRSRRNKHFTVAEANAMLPLLRSILRDVTELANSLRDRQDRLKRLRQDSKTLGQSYHEELDQVQAGLDQDQEKMHDYIQELHDLGVELKDPFTGLLDFRSILDEREVYLCWRLGEAEVAHWHELDSGFAGRQPILENASRM